MDLILSGGLSSSRGGCKKGQHPFSASPAEKGGQDTGTPSPRATPGRRAVTQHSQRGWRRWSEEENTSPAEHFVPQRLSGCLCESAAPHPGCPGALSHSRPHTAPQRDGGWKPPLSITPELSQTSQTTGFCPVVPFPCTC